MAEFQRRLLANLQAAYRAARGFGLLYRAHDGNLPERFKNSLPPIEIAATFAAVEKQAIDWGTRRQMAVVDSRTIDDRKTGKIEPITKRIKAAARRIRES